jgi:hypothetical protein
MIADVDTIRLHRLSDYLAEDRDDGLNGAVRRELAETIVAALARLKLSYRHVLALRCYEQMSFAEMAELMDCKELRARVLFFRAKHALHRESTRRGYSRELLLTGLGLFGVLTGPADSVSAAGTVHATSLNVGLLATVVGAVGTRAGQAMIATAAGATVSIRLDQIVYFCLFGSLALVSFINALCWEWPGGRASSPRILARAHPGIMAVPRAGTERGLALPRAASGGLGDRRPRICAAARSRKTRFLLAFDTRPIHNEGAGAIERRVTGNA